MLKYYYRLEKSQSNFPLLYDAFIESKRLSDINKLSWFSSIDVVIKKMQSSRPVHNPNSRINDKIYTIILSMIGNKIVHNIPMVNCVYM